MNEDDLPCNHWPQPRQQGQYRQQSFPQLDQAQPVDQGRFRHKPELEHEPVLLVRQTRPDIQPMEHAQEFSRNFLVRIRESDDTTGKEETPWRRRTQWRSSTA